MNEIQKNIVSANIDADGNVIVGDGNTIINLKEAAQYKAIEAEIQELNERFEKAKQKSIKYPDDQDFAVDLINIDGKRSERQKDLETLRQEVIKLAEDFARIPINTERLKKAKAHFENGEFAEARAVLDAEVMGQELDALLDQKETLSIKTQENQQNLSDKANEYLILARLTATNFELPNRFEKTVLYFEQSLRAERNVENTFAFAYFLKEHNQYKEAKPLYEEALLSYRTLAKSKPEVFLQYVPMTLNNLAVLHCNNNEIEKAQGEYEEALQIYRILAQSNPDVFLPYFAKILNNLAALHYAKNELQQAQGEYEEALQIYRTFVKSNPDAFLPYVAGTLNNLALLHRAKNELQQSQGEFEEALKIRRNLAQSNPDIFLPYLAQTLNNLAALHYAKNELQQAQGEFEEALKIFQTLAQSNPDAFLPYVAGTLNNLAALHDAKNEMQQAQGEFEEALKIFQTLAQSNPEVFLPDVVNIAKNMAVFYQSSIPDQEKSLELVKECIQAGLPFREILPNVKNYMRSAINVVQKWGLDVEKFLKGMDLEKETHPYLIALQSIK